MPWELTKYRTGTYVIHGILLIFILVGLAIDIPFWEFLFLLFGWAILVTFFYFQGRAEASGRNTEWEGAAVELEPEDVKDGTVTLKWKVRGTPARNFKVMGYYYEFALPSYPEEDLEAQKLIVNDEIHQEGTVEHSVQAPCPVYFSFFIKVPRYVYEGLVLPQIRVEEENIAHKTLVMGVPAR